MTASPTTQPRHPKGAPAGIGGEWREATRDRVADSIALSGPSDLGDVTHIKVGSRTPWGSAQSADHLAAGVVVVSTSSHGGIKLSPERNAQIPSALRQPTGWYEEDARSHIPAAYLPDAFPGAQQSAVAGLKNWFPDQYEEATGQSVSPDESFLRRRQAEAADAEAFRDAHRHDFVTTGGSCPSWCPTGYELVDLERRADGTTTTVMVPSGFWSRNATDRTDTPIVVNPNAHVDVTDLVERHKSANARPSGEKIHDLGISYGGLTPTMEQRARTELSDLRRTPEDGVTTLAGYLASRGVIGKSASVFSGDKAMTYYLELGDDQIFPVTQATYVALAGVPEILDDYDRARNEVWLSRIAQDKALKEHLRAPRDSKRNDTLLRAEQRTRKAQDVLSDLERQRGAAAKALNDDLNAQASARLGA